MTGMVFRAGNIINYWVMQWAGDIHMRFKIAYKYMVVEINAFLVVVVVVRLSDQGNHVSATELDSHLRGGYLPDKDRDVFESIRK